MGIAAELVAKLTDLYNQANELEQQRNNLKADSREKTTIMLQTMRDLNKQCSLARKSIRVSLPEEKWPAFGFRAGEFSSKEPQPESEPDEV